MPEKTSTTQQKIISFYFRHPDAFVRMVSEFYAFKPHEIRKYFQRLNPRLISNSFYCEWDSETIREYKHQLDWNLLSASCRAFADANLIGEFKSEVVWKNPDPEHCCNCLSCNPKISWTPELIQKYEKHLDFNALSFVEWFPWTEAIIDRNIDRINWEGISYLSSFPWSEQFLAKYEDYWDWDSIILNEKIPWTIPLVEKYFHRFNHLKSSAFASNRILTSNAEIIEEFADHLCWNSISNNPELPWLEMNLLERWKDRIEWPGLSQNEFFLRNSQFFERNLEHWLTDPKYYFCLLAYRHSLPWSIPFIDRFIDYWDWRVLSQNECLPWNMEFIDYYIDKWEWGSFGPCEDVDDVNCGKRGLISNAGIPWNIDWLIKYEDYLDIEVLKSDWFIWNKAFRPFLDEKTLDTIFRLI